MIDIVFDKGIDLIVDEASHGFRYGRGVFGPAPELRQLDAVRSTLLDRDCTGPDPVYSIAMDVGRHEHREELIHRNLLFGVARFSTGLLGRELVRSQGHVHKQAPHSGWSPPELFEVWEGRAIIYGQERSEEDPGRCFAVIAEPGEHIIVPPGWAHFVANADPERQMVFAALCDRQYGFEYAELRRREGPAWFPIWNGAGVDWLCNTAYQKNHLHLGTPADLTEFGVVAGEPLYRQFAADAGRLQWVSEPARLALKWENFIPISKHVAC